MKAVVRYLRKVALVGKGEDASDGQLLEAFLTQRDEAAFEALLRRHGPMVLGVCRRVLRNPHDAEDAYQATFLVLVRKAATVRPRELVGNWLYGVACRTAMKARAMSTKRRIKERQVPGAARSEDSADAAQEELLQHLDVELNRLPDKYRVPVVLCELEGRSRKNAARLLGLPEGTLSWRLAQARKLLARRLSRRGLALSAGGLAAVFSEGTALASPCPILLSSTARVAMQVAAGRALTAGAVSAQVVTVTEGVLKAMLLSKLKVIGVLALAVSIGIGATGLTYRAVGAEPGQTREASPRMRAALDELEELRLEIEALRKGLQATRKRVTSLESEVETLKQRAAAPMGMMGGGLGLGGLGLGGLGLGGGLGGPGLGGGMMGMGGGGMMGMGGGGVRGGSGFGGGGLSGGFGGGMGGGRGGLKGTKGTENQKPVAKPKAAPDPLAEAEKALKELRQHPDSKQAADRLERAVQQLKGQAKPKPSGN